MIKVYFYYPTPNTVFSIHTDPECKSIQKHQHGEEQRVFHINLHNLSEKLYLFVHKEVRFAAEAGLNDLYLFIDLENRDFEIAVVNYVTWALRQRYIPFRRINPEIHC